MLHAVGALDDLWLSVDARCIMELTSNLPRT